MKRLWLVFLAVSLASVAVLGSEFLMNDTGETVYGLRVVFSEPVEIDGFGDVLLSVEPVGEATIFLFSGGELDAWGSHWISWTPSSASITSHEWLAQHEALAEVRELQASLDALAGVSTEEICAAFPYEPSTIAKPPSAVCIDEECLAEGMAFDYLIVTRPAFLDALEPFIAWKASEGFRVGVATVEWFCQGFPGRHVAERMKTGMHALRRTAGVVYVLFVGDTSVRDYKFEIDAVLESYGLSNRLDALGPYSWNVPTGYNLRTPEDSPGVVRIGDTYFVEDRDWDRDGVGTTELGDWHVCGTLDATLFLGRWPVRLPEEIAPIVAKTMAVVPADKVIFTWNATEFGNRDRSGCPAGWPSIEDPLKPPSPFRETVEDRCYTNLACYEDAMNNVSKILEEATPWISVETIPVDIGNTEETSELLSMLSTNEDALVALFHGTRNCMEFAEDRCLKVEELAFEHVFALAHLQACYVAYFYGGTEDAFSERLLKGENGPAVVTQLANDYMYWMGLRAGLSVGEAAWRSASTWVTFDSPTILLGDPSLIVIAQP